MRALLRTTTLLAALIAVVLQLPLAGAGVGCRMETHHRMGGETLMAGMQMDGMAMSGADADRSARPADAPASGTSAPEDEVPCDHGPASAACQSMASCASALAVVLATDVAAEHGGTAASVSPAVARAPASRSIPPELPPPRA